MTRKLFSFLRPVVNLFVHYGPSSIILNLVKLTDRTYLLPPGRTFVFRKYLGDLTIHTDTTYPIELEMLSGAYDPESQAIVSQFVKPRSCCLDIGANVGALTLAMAKQVGGDGKVYAFEPGLVTFRRLQRNLSLNPTFRETVLPLQLGLSDSPGRLFWNEDPNNRGNASLSASGGAPVEVTTVDDYFRDHPLERLDFVKIDVEGMEYEVLKGGVQTWQKFQPVLYFETMQAFERERKRPLFRPIEELLAGIGYSLFKPVDGKLSRTTAADLANNTVALPERG